MIDFSQLDKTIHEKGRLAIMTLLAARAGWSFQDLKTELKMSDGNLITHLRTLIKAGYVAETREIKTRPQTSYALTKPGRTAFETYINLLDAIVRSARP
ncbi:MAG TPA: transcriptional regulator [Verrucomicrobiales bacterium]|jgi:DNA-binding HxlR family transcriptional regulator|nr:transcriptional regulator [Verrucomicrobiales bacterium]